MISAPRLQRELLRIVGSPEAPVDERAINLAEAALVVARTEYPQLDPTTYLKRLEDMGAEACERLGGAGTDRNPLSHDSISALNTYLFDEQGFEGNRGNYYDARNSFLNKVLDRRMGIPITLALVYIEVARRAGLSAQGVNFPGHFLVRCDTTAGPVILDPFNKGVQLSESQCAMLLREHLGEEATFDASLLAPAGKREFLVRILRNLKRIYVHLRSLPQARVVTELILTLDFTSPDEIRDRGLMAYHLRDYSAAARDLEDYLRLVTPKSDEERKEHEQLWDHLKALRRRLAGLN